jgi:hypothetical protein
VNNASTIGDPAASNTTAAGDREVPRHELAIRPYEVRLLTIHIEFETDAHPIECCDHEGTTEPLGGLNSVAVCTACDAI